MAKEEGIEMEGVVQEVLPDRNYRVLLDNGHTILAYAAGKMSKFKIRVLEGDRVSVRGLAELAPGRPVRVVLHHADGKDDELRASHSLSQEQLAWFRAGSALNLLRQAR